MSQTSDGKSAEEPLPIDFDNLFNETADYMCLSKIFREAAKLMDTTGSELAESLEQASLATRSKSQAKNFILQTSRQSQENNVNIATLLRQKGEWFPPIINALIIQQGNKPSIVRDIAMVFDTRAVWEIDPQTHSLFASS